MSLRDAFEFLGPAYLRYSFTRGTDQEVGFLRRVLALGHGERVLDVGCGPGRHAGPLAAAGSRVVGVDITAAFVALAAAAAPPGAVFVHGDALALPVATGSVDVALSLCEGAFGLVAPRDEQVLAEMARVLRPGGRLALSAINAYFVARHQEAQDTFDALAGVNTERTTLRNEAGDTIEADLATTCFTPRELALLCDRAGLDLDAVHGVTPGAYAERPPGLDHPELLAIATRRPLR